MKKSILLFILAVCLAFSAVSCNTGNKQPDESNTSDAAGETLPPGDVVLFGGDDDYRIVYPADATTAVKDLVVEISNAVKGVTGNIPKRVGDNSKTETEVPREILIATTNRKESNTGVENVSGLGYRVEFIGEKLVITASNDTILKEAVAKLLASWEVSDGKIIISNTTVLKDDMSGSMMSLFDNGEFRYRIVIQSSASDSVYASAQEFVSRLTVATGKTVGLVYDKMVAETDGEYEICIGQTNRKISSELYLGFENPFGYEIVTKGTRIAVGAENNDTLASAVTKLADDICSAVVSCYCGTPAIAKDYGFVGSVTASLIDFPEPQTGTSKGLISVADDEYVMYYENISKAGYQNYITTLLGKGCKTEETYTLGSNEYILMMNDDGYSVYVAYLAKTGTMRIILGKTGVPYPEASSPTVSDVCEPALWQLEVDSKGSQTNGGMSYVIQLTDGTFIVVDGGYNTATEAENLYTLLKDNTKDGGEPVISAWFITHLHVDHYGCLNSFSQKYNSIVKVKAFYYNFPGVGMGDIILSVKNSVESYMSRWSGAVKYSKLHSGMSFSVVDAQISVICTFEDVYPLTVENGNDTSVVFKVTVGTQSIMFLGDAYYNESTVMTQQIDKSVLKSDIVQMSHHGYEGCNEDLYVAVGAPVVLWPMPIVGYEGTVKNVFKKWYNEDMSANSYIRTSQTVKQIIVSGAGTAKLSLPYTPTGSRVPDYDAIYSERTK